MSEKSVILLENISSLQADSESLVRAAVSFSPFDALEEKVSGQKYEKSPAGGPAGPVEDACEAEAGTEADVEDDDVYVSGGVD